MANNRRRVPSCHSTITHPGGRKEAGGCWRKKEAGRGMLEEEGGRQGMQKGGRPVGGCWRKEAGR